jgi:hypothetical protein
MTIGQRRPVFWSVVSFWWLVGVWVDRHWARWGNAPRGSDAEAGHARQ